MIWGEAGVGKTTFCSKFCQDWALVVKEREGKIQDLKPEQKSELEKLTEEHKSKLNNIGLLIYIVLRNIKDEANTINDIVTSQLGFSKNCAFMSQPGLKEKVTNILENVIENRHLILLFDGFDEMSYNEEVIKCVTNCDSYQNLHCVTTCRPHASQGISLNVDIEIRLKGFSHTQTNAFVEMYAKIKFSGQEDQIESFVKKTMSQIESSAELLEMSTNPSMLQLLCFLSWKQDKIGKDRTLIFKDYTSYLLKQYHIKLDKKENYSDKLYHQNLLDAGKVALMGLKQNQLQLVFSKSEAHRIGGDEIFNIVFFTELPGSETEDGDNKVMFTHKTLQEYLAAFYVVNTPGNKGLQLLMEFCCTSKRLLGSQIILEFVSNMSTKMGKEIQKKIKDYVSTWDDKVDPKSRTSFLISMLEGNKKLTFPLPAVVDIDLREYDHAPGLYSKLLNIFLRSESTLERFFHMDGKGVKHVRFILANYKRLNVLTNTRINSVEELTIDYQQSWSEGDNEDLCLVMKKTKPGFLYIKNCELNLIDEATITVILQHVHTLILEKCDLNNNQLVIILQNVVNHITTKSLSICNCLRPIQINTKIAEAVSRLPDHSQLDLSGNQVTDKSASISLINKAATMKSLKIHDCMSNCGMQIDTEIAEAVSRLPDHTELDLSGNQVTDKSVCITLINKAATMKSLSICNCGIQIDTEIAEAVSRLPDHPQLDLSGNQVTDKSACITLIHKAATMTSLNICNCGIQIDTEIAEAVSGLPDHTELDLSSIQVTDKSASITLIHKAASMKSLNIHDCMSNCGIQIDKEIAEAVSRLPDHTQLDLSGNQVTDKSACITLIHKAASMKSLNIHDCMSNCGIQIDTEIAEAVSRLPDHTQLDLSGNDITKMEPYLLPRILCYMTKQEKIDIRGWGNTVDEDIVTALSKLSKLQTLIINTYDPFWYYSNNKLTSRATSALPHTVSSMPLLQVLGLDYCDISNDVMVALTDSLYKHCPLLEDLTLRYNHLSSGVWEVLKHIQQMKNLRRLCLRGNSCVKDDKQRDKIKATLDRSNPGLSIWL